MYGAALTDRFLFLRGEKGYRCFFEGSLGGAPCNYEDFLITPASSQSFRRATGIGGPLDHGYRFTITETADSGRYREIYVVRTATGSQSTQLLGLFDFHSMDFWPVTRPPRLILPVVRDSEAESLVRSIVTRQVGSCGAPSQMCGDLGIDRSYVPTLENELIEDSSLYENSWNHYLNLARQAADRADALGEQLVQAGLDMDLRAEQAQREIEAICGGVFNFDPVSAGGCAAVDQSCDAVNQYIEENPALASCLPENMGGDMSRIPFATAGSRPLCIYRNTQTGALCGEPNGGQCPLVRVEGEGCTTGDFTLDPTKVSDGILEAVLVDKTLNIFQSNSPRETSTATCADDVAMLRDKLNTSASPQHKATSIWQVLNGADWISKIGVGAIAKRLGIDVYPLHHYSVTYGNMVLWTTRVTDQAQCPCKEPWKFDSPEDCLPEEQVEGCVRGDAPTALWPPINPAQHESWLQEELEVYMPQRKAWGVEMRRLVVALGALTGSIPRVRMAGWHYRQRGAGENNYAPSDLYTDGAIAPGLYLRVLERDWADEPLICLKKDGYSTALGLSDDDEPNGTHTVFGYEHDPDVAPCHVRDEGGTVDTSYGMFRFEFPLEYEVTDSSVDTLFGFWGSDVLSSFLGGTYTEIGNQWRLRSTYVDDLVVTARVNADNERELVFLEDDRVTGWQDSKNHQFDPYRHFGPDISRFDDDWPFEDHITPRRFVDLLDFACQVSERSVGPVPECDVSDPSKVPFVDSKNDIDKLAAYLDCASNDIQRVAERIILPNLPNKLVEGFQKNGLEGYYGDYSGENLKALLAIEANLRALGTAGDSIKTILFEAAQELRNVKLEIENIDLRKVITGLRTTQAVLRTAFEIIQAWKGAEAKTLDAKLSGTQTGILATIGVLESIIGGFEQEVLKNNEDQAYVQAMLAFSRKMGELKATFNGIADAYSQIQSNLATMDQNQNRAIGWWAMGMGLDGDLAGHVYPVNTVMRRRMNTLRIRYEEASRRAKILAFIARRAIEFRLGVDLSQMQEEMTLVPAPSSWADRVCDMQGFDYDRLRDAFPEDEELLDPQLQGGDNYAHWYIGDYVTLLSDFVESYNLDHPFTDERDIAVISVKDDLMKARAPCEIPSRNLLYFSESIGESRPLDESSSTGIVGWKRGGCKSGIVMNCVPDSEETSSDCEAEDNCAQVLRDVEASSHCSPQFCYGMDPEAWAESGLARPHGADLLYDVRPPEASNPVQNGRIVSWENTGYYEQVVTGVPSGDYILSWWARHPTSMVESDNPEYRVEVHETIAPEGDTDPIVHGISLQASVTEWQRKQISFRLGEGQDLRVRLHPSANDDTAGGDALAEFGAVWIWGIQLERVYCGDSSCSGVTPDAYQSNNGKVTVTEDACPDTDGAVLRSGFEYRCICLDFENGICPEGSEGAPYRSCYWEYPFEILMSRIEHGDLIPSNNISIGNFNYRHEALAVNVVGTNVIDCSDPLGPSSCYTNAFVPYTLQHMGWVEVKNHERKTMEYSMPIARVEHGKGLTAEVVITNPVTGTHTGLLSEYWKDGLRGRPIQGQYMIRIWDTSNINWSNIEDIQIVWKYRYWTQMSGY